MNKKGFLHKLPAHSILIIIGLALAFLVSACESTALAAPAESIIYEVQTSVVETVSAQESPSLAPRSTPAPTASAMPTPYPTLATATPMPTSQSWYETYSTAYGCNASEFVRDVTIPDGTILLPGDTFIKTWKFKNTGKCEWEEDYLVVFVEGNDMDGDAAYLDTTVAVNKKGDVSVVLTAPDEEGTYYGYWQLADQDGYLFGDLAYVEIVVSEDATSTPTPTPTSTLTSTYTPTATQTSTYTPTPTSSETQTSTYTPTPTPTSTTVETATDTPTPTPTNTLVSGEEATEEPTDD